MLTPWLLAVAMGLAALVLFGSIERNLQSANGATVMRATPLRLGAACRPEASAVQPKTCNF